MITMQTLLQQLTGEEIYDSLIHFMTEEFEDFAVARNQYERAMDILRAELGEPLVLGAMGAIQQQTVSNLLFSGFLGIKANLDNFMNPLSRNFLKVDSEIYLREKTAHRMPEYERAQSILDQFHNTLSPDQKELHEDVIVYVSYLETIAPKLAHYYGYLLGNELLPHVIPGYYADMVLTVQYRMMLRDYFGKESSVALPVRLSRT